MGKAQLQRGKGSIPYSLIALMSSEYVKARLETPVPDSEMTMRLAEKSINEGWPRNKDELRERLDKVVHSIQKSCS